MSISYAIGKAEPTAVEIDTFGTARVDEDVIRLAVLDVFDLRPAAIMSLLHLRAPMPPWFTAISACRATTARDCSSAGRTSTRLRN